MLVDDAGLTTLAGALRWYRRAAGLSQERLAERSAVSVRTIRNIESGRVAAPRLTSVWALADGLGIEGVERARFRELGVSEDIDDDVELESQRSVAAPLTPLVGRAADLTSLLEVLSSGTARLVTLTGVAGVGKSRLANELVARLRQSGRPVWWVPLASIGDSKFVLDALAAAVGSSVFSMDAVARQVGRRGAVLAFDNLEHLDGVGVLLAELLARLPGTTVLATSRRPVGVPGEHEWLVGPLEVPAADEVELSALMSVGSVQLLVERVRAVVPRFALTPANARIVSELCRLLDGLPLALELAAKQWRVRGGAGLTHSVRRNPLALRDIADPGCQEHASVLNALEASWSLLSDAERRTFGSLSVFPADWGIDAAIAVAGGGAAVDHLDRLVALGLVASPHLDADAEPRLSMLPTIRSFAARKARRDGSHEAASARHAGYFCSWLAGIAGGDGAPDARVESERDNLRAALDWYGGNGPQRGLAMAVLLFPHWRRRGRDEEGLECLQGLLASVGDHDLVPDAQQQAATLANVIGRFHLASHLAGQSLAGFRSRGDSRGCARALGTLGMIALVTDPVGAVTHCEAAVAQAEQIDDAELLAWLTERLAVSLAQLGRFDEATAAIERALAISTEHGLQLRQIQALVKLAIFRYLHGDLGGADRLLEAAKPLVADAEEVVDRAAWRAARAVVSANLGDGSRASQLVLTNTEWARDYGNTVIADLTAWARAELELVGGAFDEAAAILRPALASQRPLGLPFIRVAVLAGLAVAATDINTAALAVGAVELMCDGYAMQLPATPASRVEAARERWVSASGADAWAVRVAAASRRTFADVVGELIEPR